MQISERLRFVLDNTFVIKTAEDVWMQTPNRRLGNRTPEDVLRDGFEDDVAAAAWAISMDNPECSDQ